MMRSDATHVKARARWGRMGRHSPRSLTCEVGGRGSRAGPEHSSPSTPGETHQHTGEWNVSRRRDWRAVGTRQDCLALLRMPCKVLYQLYSTYIHVHTEDPGSQCDFFPFLQRQVHPLLLPDPITGQWTSFGSYMLRAYRRTLILVGCGITSAGAFVGGEWPLITARLQG